MGKSLQILIWLWTALVAASAVRAGSPELHLVQPAGIQRGIDAALTLRGVRLAGAAEVLFYQPGISATTIENTDDDTVSVRCTVAADCPLGEHHLRLRTGSGISDMRTVWVGALPVVTEVEPNGDFAAPQLVPMNSTVAGVVTSEDIDYYAVEAKEGDRISAEIEAMRLGRTMFDPAIAILNAARFELAVSDDSSLLLQDSTASVIAPADGRYVIAVREASFGGNDQSTYLLHIGTFPRPTVASPPGARFNESAALSLLGDPTGPISIDQLIVPESADDHFPVFASTQNLSSPSPVWIRAGSMPVVTEPQSAPGIGTIQSPVSAPPASAPAAAPSPPTSPIAFQGVIAKAGEVDRYRFTATKGVGLVISAHARRVRSPLDPVIHIVDAAGKWLAGNDDSAGVDSVLAFTPPEDGEYEVRISDHLGRGGDTFVYRIELETPRPTLAVSLDRMDAKRPQHLQAIAVPKGNRFAAMIRVERQNIGGAVAIETTGLPAGISATAVPVEADGALAPVVFEASADASLAGSLVDVNGRIAGASGAPDVIGAFTQTMPLVIAPPNETVYYQTSVHRLAVAVTDSAPFKIDLAQPAAPLLQSGSKLLKIHVTRAESFTGEVVLQMLWNPPGVSSALNVTIPADKSDIDYPINAAPDAPIRHWKIAALGRAAVNGGDIWASTALADLSVEPPFFNGSLQMAAAERGKSVGMLCKLEPRRPFEGKAVLTLLGLPPNTSCAPKEVSASDTELVFDVQTTPEAPVGQHGGLFCELRIEQNGETVNHRLAGGGALRIDAPPVVAAASPPAPAPAPAPVPTAAPPRPLSRLEQLRKAAAERATKNEENPTQ